MVSSMTAEVWLNRISMVSLIAAGAIFIVEGIKYIRMKKRNPDIPDKIYAAAVLAIVLGVAEIAFGVAHIWMLPKNAS